MMNEEERSQEKVSPDPLPHDFRENVKADDDDNGVNVDGEERRGRERERKSGHGSPSRSPSPSPPSKRYADVERSKKNEEEGADFRDRDKYDERYEGSERRGDQRGGRRDGRDRRDRRDSRDRRDRRDSRDRRDRRDSRDRRDRRDSRDRRDRRDRRDSRDRRDRRGRRRSPSYEGRSFSRRDRDRDRDRNRPRSRESSDDDYGYRPRRRGRKHSTERARMAKVEDPFAKLRAATGGPGNAAVDPSTIARQMQEQQLRARQLVLQQQAASAVAAASKTQREVYVGNLVPGVVTEPMLRQLFNATLQAAFPDHCVDDTQEPVVRINMAPEGKYCFIEMLSSDMATACLQLTGQIQLAGSALSIGRPTGYVDPVKAQAAAQSAAEGLARFQAESQLARKAAGADVDSEEALRESPFLQINGLVTAQVLIDNSEYEDVLNEVRSELEKYGILLRVTIPRPEEPVGTEEEVEAMLAGGEGGSLGNVFAQYLDGEGARAAKAAIDGRLFAGQRITATQLQAMQFMEAVGQKLQ